MKLQYLTKKYVKIVTPIARLAVLHQLRVKLVKMENIYIMKNVKLVTSIVRLVILHQLPVTLVKMDNIWIFNLINVNHVIITVKSVLQLNV